MNIRYYVSFSITLALLVLLPSLTSAQERFVPIRYQLKNGSIIEANPAHPTQLLFMSPVDATGKSRQITFDSTEKSFTLGEGVELDRFLSTSAPEAATRAYTSLVNILSLALSEAANDSASKMAIQLNLKTIERLLTKHQKLVLELEKEHS